jgi:hypothetical protein
MGGRQKEKERNRKDEEICKGKAIPVTGRGGP